MAKKLYLSAAAHQHDNPTKCPDKCGENVHCKAYMDIVEKRMKEHGVEVMRGGKSMVGTEAMQLRVYEAGIITSLAVAVMVRLSSSQYLPQREQYQYSTLPLSVAVGATAS